MQKIDFKIWANKKTSVFVSSSKIDRNWMKDKGNNVKSLQTQRKFENVRQNTSNWIISFIFIS